MIVCLCEGVNDRQIRRAIDDGCRTVKAIGRTTRAGTDCGTCRCQVKALLTKARQGAAPAEGSMPLAASPRHV